MAAFAVLKLGDEFRRLLWDSGPLGANDLNRLHDLVHRWFEGSPVYPNLHYALYPPASYVMLWPFMGWLEFTPARWLWAITSLAALACLTWILLRQSRAETRLERIFVAMLLLSMNATGVTIGNGQLTLHVLLALVAGLLLLDRNRDSWGDHVLAGGLLLLALVKPTVSLPFIWMGLFLATRAAWLAVFIACGYVVLTLWAASAQPAPLSQLLHEWLARGSDLAGRAGYANLHVWMGGLGLSNWMLPASVVLLLVLGVWVFRHRQVDRWILLGVSALVARFWAYHRMYDDMLVLLPMLALFRIAKRGPSADGSDVTAAGLLTVMVLPMLAPARLGFDTSPWVGLFNNGHALVWLSVLFFLLACARRQRPAVGT